MLIDGSGLDTLHGDDGNDDLTVGFVTTRQDAKAGVDRAFGDDGDDRLRTYSSRALLAGGPGNDTLDFVPSIESAALRCDAGRDTLTGDLKGQQAGAGCERLRVGMEPALASVALVPRLAGTAIELPVGVLERIRPLTRCAGAVYVRLRRSARSSLQLGRAAFAIRAGRTGVVRVALARPARVALQRARVPTLLLTVRATCTGRSHGQRAAASFVRRWRSRAGERGA